MYCSFDMPLVLGLGQCVAAADNPLHIKMHIAGESQNTSVSHSIGGRTLCRFGNLDVCERDSTGP